MSENSVREIHDAAPHSRDHVQASVRPDRTMPRQLRAITSEVLHKLDVGPRTSVLEIGCGIGVLGVPVARRAAAYVGFDFAPQVVEVCQTRLADAGLGRALVGNVPLEDLEADRAPTSSTSATLFSRDPSWLRWAAAPAHPPVLLSHAWKIRRILKALDVERWLAAIEGSLRYRRLSSGPGVPLASGRADLIIERMP